MDTVAHHTYITSQKFSANLLEFKYHTMKMIESFTGFQPLEEAWAEHQPSFMKMRELGIEPHVVDFPTRHFWDGAIHCITVDIRRSGGCLDYFNA